MRPRIDVVIVNWNSGSLLGECLTSIRDHGGGVGRVIAVDNGSTDGSADLAEPGPGVEIVRNGENLGFAAACNVGLRHCAAEFVLFLNPDTKLFPGTINDVLAFMDSPPAEHIGICGIRLLDEAGRTTISSARVPSAMTYFNEATGLSKLFPRIFKPLLMVEFPHLESRDVDQVIGAFMLVRKQVVEQIGGLDERFFVYFEDLDYCIRAREAGWRVHHFAGASAYHLGQGTTNKVKALRLFYSLRSRIQFARMYFNRFNFVAVLGITMFLEPVARMLFGLLRGSLTEAKEAFTGTRLFYRALPGLLSRSGRGRPRTMIPNGNLK